MINKPREPRYFSIRVNYKSKPNAEIKTLKHEDIVTNSPKQRSTSTKEERSH